MQNTWITNKITDKIEEELLKLLESLPGMTFIYFKNISTDFIQ